MASGSAAARLTQADRVYVGWRYAQVHPDPGPPPEAPAEPERPAARPPVRQPGEHMAARPLRIAATGTLVFVLLFLVCGIAGVLPWLFAGVGLVACAIVLGITGGALWRDERAVRERLERWRDLDERERAKRERARAAAREEHAEALREWERRRADYDRQREWYPVAVPPGVDRVDVVGGTLSGWSAAVTTMGAARLAVGARLTVIDLSEGAVAHDLLRLAADRGDDPLVWVLPNDLPRLDVTRGLSPEALREWERRRADYDRQREWYPVAVPPGVDRVDVVGGTLSGWSAAVTTMGAARLAVGARLTVIDLSEGAVAHDLLRLAADRGDDPLVWVLPNDLPRLDVTRGLSPEALADVLSLVVGAGEEQDGTRDLSFDNSILERLIEVLGADTTIPRITAALRVLAQVGDPRDDLRRGLLTEEQLDRIATLFGRDATDRIVVRRAWALEAQLRKLERLAAEPVRLPPSRLHVVSMDRRAGVLTNRVLGTYVTTALTHRVRESPPGGRWDHTLFLCGAEKLRGDVLDRLIDACEATGTGLVLMYRSIPQHVRERLGRRGHAAVGFMRLGNPDDARVAAEHIGTDKPLLVAEITDSAGETLFDFAGETYASTVAYARPSGDGLTDPVWSPLPAPAADDSALVEGISSATAWGRTVAERRAAGKQRFRELLVGPPQLQELPPTAMVFTHAGATGRRIMLVDANPGIITLPTAHSMEFEEYLREQEALARDEPLPAPVEPPAGEPPRTSDGSRPRHALPRRTNRIVPILRPNGKHAADPPAAPDPRMPP